MPPRGVNTKKESGRTKKAENEEKKKESAAAEKERKEAEAWKDTAKTSKSKQEEKEEKRKADLARKAENARILAEEEASSSVKKAVSKPAKKGTKEYKPAGPGAIAAGGPDENPEAPVEQSVEQPVDSFAATGIDNALDILEVVTAKMDKASVGQQAAGIERHPERRFKAAFEAYQERELPNIKKEHPGLRLQQYKDLLYKQFQKSPENPFNQTIVAHDASKEEKLEALKQKRMQVEERLRDKSG